MEANLQDLDPSLLFHDRLIPHGSMIPREESLVITVNKFSPSQFLQPKYINIDLELVEQLGPLCPLFKDFLDRVSASTDTFKSQFKCWEETGAWTTCRGSVANDAQMPPFRHQLQGDWQTVAKRKTLTLGWRMTEMFSLGTARGQTADTKHRLFVPTGPR